MRRPELVASAVLCDPPLLAFVPEANEALSAQRQQLEDALREGGPPAAIDHWLGPDATPEELSRGQASPRGFFADYAGLATWAPSRRELRGIGVPVVFVTGPDSGPHVIQAADEGAGLRARERRDARTATSSRLSEATDYTAEPVPAPHRCAPLR